MPELPEVETIKSQLTPYLPFKVEQVYQSEFAKNLIKDKKDFSAKDKKLVEIKRHGKFLIFVFEHNLYLISHLGMSGGWRYSDSKITVKHTHLQLKGVSRGKPLFMAYVDPRRFGRILFYNQKHFDAYMLERGIDISTKNFNLTYLKSIVERFPKKILKPFLLDQHYFAGIGNYIASEICVRAHVLPTRLMNDLSTEDLKNILQATKSILKDTIKSGGTTFAGGYADANGDKGLGVQNLIVFYQKTCGFCKKESVVKIIQQGRGTYYCPNCQK